MSILSVEGVSKGFGLKPLLEGVTFSLEADEKMGVIGMNGSGKTTLLRLVAGAEPPESGRVTLARGAAAAYLPQQPTFQPEHTVLDAVFDGGSAEARLLHDYEAAARALEHGGGKDPALQARVAELGRRLDVSGGWDLEAHARAVLSRLGIDDTEAPVAALSGGQAKRVALARALILRPDLLLLDEPTNHLDADTIGWLEAYLARYTGALLLVTHDRYFLDRVTNRMLELEDGQAWRFEGNYTYYLEKKEEQAEQRAAEHLRRNNLVRRELAWLRRGAKARTTKQKARVERAQALLETPDEAPARRLEAASLSTRLGNKVVELEGVTKGYGGRTLIDRFSYKFTRGDRIGIIGPNGSGKTTLLEMIAGRLAPDAGTVEIGQTAVIGYYDQQSRALNDEQRVIDYIKDAAEFVRAADGSLVTAAQMLERFLFTPAAQYTPIGRLSGGERRRLYLLRVLMQAPNVLLLDEPTNDLDIPTLTALEEYAEGFAGCLVVVSHDRYFLDRTAEHIFRIEEGGAVRAYPGNYSAFLEARRREEEAAAQQSAAAPAPAPRAAPAGAPGAGARKLSYKERRELEALEARIAEAEAARAVLEARLQAEAADYAAVAEISAALQTLGAALDRDVERWAELAELA